MTEPIVISGLGFVCPLGTGVKAVWEAWAKGETGVRRLSEDDSRLARGVDPSSLPEVGRAGFVRGFAPKEHIQSPHLRRMDWCSRMIVASATQAVADARLPLDLETQQVRTGLVFGLGFGNQRETQEYIQRLLDRGPAAGHPMLFPNLVLNAAAGYAAIELAVRGPNLSVSEHEASGEIAVVAAVDLLRAGMCDRVIVGGADEFGSVYLGALRERRLLDGESSPEGPRPNASRGRIIPGEGAAALVLERASDLTARGGTPYATIGAAASGAVPAGPYTAPEPEAAAARIFELLEPTNGSAPAVSTILGGANGTRAREALDRAVLDGLATRQAEPTSRVCLNPIVGDWPARGSLAVALAALAARNGRVPGAEPSESDAVARILIPGSGRSGVVVPIAVDPAPR